MIGVKMFNTSFRVLEENFYKNQEINAEGETEDTTDNVEYSEIECEDNEN